MRPIECRFGTTPLARRNKDCGCLVNKVNCGVLGRERMDIANLTTRCGIVRVPTAIIVGSGICGMAAVSGGTFDKGGRVASIVFKGGMAAVKGCTFDRYLGLQGVEFNDEMGEVNDGTFTRYAGLQGFVLPTDIERVSTETFCRYPTIGILEVGDATLGCIKGGTFTIGGAMAVELPRGLFTECRGLVGTDGICSGAEFIGCWGGLGGTLTVSAGA